jgi:hypothetical protein
LVYRVAQRVRPVDLEAARLDLIRALDAHQTATTRAANFAAARAILIEHGIAALRIASRSGLSLDDVIRAAVSLPQSEARRDFAVLLVHALAVEGLLPARGEPERAIHALLERALLNPLRRARYPFDGTPYDKRRALAGLHASIEEHLRPPEPSIPRWLHGIGPADST